MSQNGLVQKSFEGTFNLPKRERKSTNCVPYGEYVITIPCNMYILLEVGQGILKILSKKVCLLLFVHNQGLTWFYELSNVCEKMIL